MDRFSKLHPLMQFLFFVVIMVITLTVQNPVFSVISLLSSALYLAMLRGKKALQSLKLVALILITVSLFNMLFAHYGEDVLFKIKDVEFTLEALFYGFNQGMVLSSVILWFSAFSRVIDSERVIYLFRFAPKTALLFSMVLGFIPRFTNKLDDIKDAQLALCGGERPKGVKAKMKNALDTLSVLISYSLESSIITADSMEARGYNPRAVRYSRYKYTVSDIVLICLISAFGVYTFIQIIMKHNLFIFEPKIYVESLDIASVIAFAMLCLIPVVVDLIEEILWKLSSVRS